MYIYVSTIRWLILFGSSTAVQGAGSSSMKSSMAMTPVVQMTASEVGRTLGVPTTPTHKRDIVSGTDGRGFTRFAMICLAGEIEPKTRTYEELRGPETRGSPGTRFSKSAAATKVILWNPDDPQVHSIESTGGSPSTRSPDAGFRGGTVGATCLRGRAEPGVGFV